MNRVNRYQLESIARDVARAKGWLATAHADAERGAAGPEYVAHYEVGVCQGVTAELFRIIDRLTKEANAGPTRQQEADDLNDALLNLCDAVKDVRAARTDSSIARELAKAAELLDRLHPEDVAAVKG